MHNKLELTQLNKLKLVQHNKLETAQRDKLKMDPTINKYHRFAHTC